MENDYIQNFLAKCKTAKNVAELMDSKNQYKKTASISAISMNDSKLSDIDLKIEKLLGNQSKLDKIEQLTFEISRQQLAYENRLNAYEQDNRYLQHQLSNTRQEPNINAVTSKTANVPSKPRWTPRREWQNNWKLDDNGYPVRCDKCGLRGHLSNECRGTNKRCEICGCVGHTKFAGDYHSKNEWMAQMNKQ